MNALHSRICKGWVRHRRHLPKPHAFRYPLFMSWLDLDKIDELINKSRFWSKQRFNLVAFYREDFLGPTDSNLRDAVKARIEQQTNEMFEGRICLLTHLRYLGFAFNPVSFYFCFPESSDQPTFILAEITNTPWGERFCYVLDTRQSTAQNGKWNFEFGKAFHVSPFMPMDIDYRWRFALSDDKLTIHMQLHRLAQCCFDATLQLDMLDPSPKTMRSVPLQYPFITCAIVFRIYWHAFRLWLKGIPFYSHPDKQTE